MILDQNLSKNLTMKIFRFIVSVREKFSVKFARLVHTSDGPVRTRTPQKDSDSKLEK